MARKPQKDIVALAGVAGAVALGGKLVRDRRADAKREAQRARFRLYEDEAVPDGIRRIARGQLEGARAELADRPKRKLAAGVHEARKSFKRLRATLRLARGAIGDEQYARENAAFRDMGRRLSDTRDASVLIETLDALARAAGEDLPEGATAELRRRLERDRDQALESLNADETLVGAVISDIEQARTRTAAWTFTTEGFDALEPGLHRIYRRGRKAMRRARADPTSEHMHEWRKRVKDLWHAEQVLRPADPKKMKKLARRTHALADLLGDDHDLAELRRYVGRHPDCFDDATAEGALIAVIDRRRAALQRKAFKRGSDLYKRRPRRFVRAIARRWRKRTRAPRGSGADVTGPPSA